jgi:hypothetical protein
VYFVLGERSHTVEALSVHLVAADIEKLMEFLSQKTIRCIGESRSLDRAASLAC